MDIIVLLFVVILIVIDKNVRQRMFAVLSSVVNLRDSIDTDSDTYDIDDDTDDTAMSQRSDMNDKRSDNRDNHSDTRVTTMSQHSDRHVTRDKRNDKHVTSNVTDDTDNVTVSHEAIDAVSRLVAANVISATRACQIAFNVTSRGNTAIYRAVRERVAELKKMSHTTQNDDIIDIRSDGRVIRCDMYGKYYVIHADGSKEYVEIEEVAK